MKKLLFVLAAMMWMPVTAISSPSTGKAEINIKLHVDCSSNYKNNWDKSKERRTPAWIPVKASYDADNLYFYAHTLMNDVIIQVKDESDNIVYEITTTLLPDNLIKLPVCLDEGTYILEIENGSITYCGDFEI